MSETIRTLETIDADRAAVEESITGLEREITAYEEKLARLNEGFAEASRALIAGKKNADPQRFRSDAHVIEFHLGDLRSQLEQKRSQLEALDAERQPLALERARQADLTQLAKLQADVDAAREAWLESLKVTQKLEQDFYAAQRRHRLEADRISDTWSKLKTPAVA
jgi:chromosome segregation ATPase